MIVTFCGHSEVSQPEAVRRWLEDLLVALVEQGADTFYIGGYGAFDRLAAGVLRGCKARYPHLNIVLILPYLTGNRAADGYDDTIYPPLETVPPRVAVLRRNQWMVERSDLLVAYVIHSWGGAAKTLDYAKRRRKPIVQYPELTSFAGTIF